MSTFASTIQDTAKTASDAASGAAKVAGKKVQSGYGSVLDLVITGVKLIPTVTAALGFMGLQKKQSNALGQSLSFGAGVLLGAGAGMLFAPKSGSDMRQGIVRYFQGTPLEHAAQTVAKKVDAVANDMGDKVDGMKNDLKSVHVTGNGTRSVS